MSAFVEGNITREEVEATEQAVVPMLEALIALPQQIQKNVLGTLIVNWCQQFTGNGEYLAYLDITSTAARALLEAVYGDSE